MRIDILVTCLLPLALVACGAGFNDRPVASAPPSGHAAEVSPSGGSTCNSTRHDPELGDTCYWPG